MPVPIIIAGSWLVLGAIAVALVVGGNLKPTPSPPCDPAIREDREVADLEAMWALPTRTPASRPTGC